MESDNSPLFYCSECLHVYFKLPDSGFCAICSNEISVMDQLSDLNISICETCHTIYTPQNTHEMIPKIQDNPDYLCGCKYGCPTHSLLKSGNLHAFVGNIVLAELYKCSNCKGVYYRNRENLTKECQNCNSVLVNLLNIDPESQKTFFKCANPSHGIRLKKRDLIIEHNNQIKNHIQSLSKQDEELQRRFQIKEQDLEKQRNRLTKKIKDEQQKRDELRQWAIKERLKIYSQIPLTPLRCSIYRMENIGGKTVFRKTKDGCGALAEINIRKKIVADAKETMFGQPPAATEDLDIAQDISTNIAPQIKDSNVLQTKMQPLIKTEIAKPEVLIEDILKTRFADLPELGTGQLYIFLELTSLIEENSYHYGVLPLQVLEKDKPVIFGRDQVLQAYWDFPENFDGFNSIIENIPPNASMGLFNIDFTSIGANLSLSAGVYNDYNGIQLKGVDGNADFKLDTPISINNLQFLRLPLFTSLEKYQLRIFIRGSSSASSQEVL